MKLTAELLEGASISWGAIRANKMRSALTTLGIVIGIVTVTLMGSAIAGLSRAFYQSLSAIGSDVLYIEKFSWAGSDEEWWKIRNRRDIRLEDARRVMRQTTMARAVAVEAMRFRNVSYKTRLARAVFTIGNTEESALIRGLTIKSGRFFTAGEVDGARPVCVLGAELAENLFGYEDPVGKKVKIEEASFEVIGVLDKLGRFLFGNLDNQIIIPITRFVTTLARDPGVNIVVKVKDIRLMDEAKEELRGIMRKIRRLPPGAPDDFAINQQEVILDFFNTVIATLATAGLFITGLSLFVGGIGIMNIMFVSVTERTREIGIRKAIGAKRRTILIQFLIEAVMICLIGGVLALMIAVPLNVAISKATDGFLPPTIPIPLVSLAAGVAVLTGLLSGFLPAYRAARLNPVDALRKE